jgi:hypothetical protein
MAGPEIVERDVLAEAADALKGVPLALAKELVAAPAAAPHLSYRGGALLCNVEVFPTFWGPGWDAAPQSEALTTIEEFFDFVLSSALIDQLEEYSVPGKTIGHGKRIPTPDGKPAIVPAHLPSTLSDGSIRHRLKHLLSTDPRFPQPGPNTLYFIYLPPGVRVHQGGGSSCQEFCGYHDAINGQIFYAVMPWPGCGGCTGELTEVEALTSTSSHELCEAITDPVPPQGWYDEANGEIGDICAWKTKKLGAFTVQLEWSNKQGACA